MGYLVGAVLIGLFFVGSFFVPGKQRAVGATVAALVFAIYTLGFAVLTVDAGQVAVTKLFGKVQEGYYPEGLHIINPLLTAVNMDTRRRVMEFTDRNALLVLASDKVNMVVDASLPYILNPRMAYKIHQRYGHDYERSLVYQAARSAIRDAVATVPWERATSDAGREELADRIAKRFKEVLVLVLDLVKSGFEREEAESAFTLPNAQVRRIEPPRRILDAIAEEQAAEADLRRQKTLTDIARQEAERRENDGLGIRKMMEILPKDYTVEEMVAMINANAAKTNSEAFMKAVEAGNANITVVVGSGGGNAPDIAVPAGGRK